MKYLFFCKESLSGVTSKVRIGETMSVYSSSLDYAVILWRKGDLSIVDAGGLKVLDFSKGTFSELPPNIQSRIVDLLNSKTDDRKSVILAQKLLPIAKILFNREQHGEMQRQYMRHIVYIQKLSLSSDFYPVIKPAGYGFEYTYKELSLTTTSMLNVELEALFKALVSEVTVDELQSLFTDCYDLISIPDRVNSYLPLRPLNVALQVERNSEYPTKKRLKSLMSPHFPLERGLIDRCKCKVMRLLGKREPISNQTIA